jgi:LPXTG-site transpeptidase (sortase) family protein
MKALNKICFITLLLYIFVALNGVSAESLLSATTTDFVFTRNLTVGISGSDVLALQRFLIAGSYLKIVAPTNYFGSLTRMALGKWQATLGIYPSAGYFGSISRGKINTAGTQQTPIYVPPIVSSTVGTTTITLGTGGGVAVTNNGNGSPVRLKIPALNIDAGFQYTGLTSLGVMEIPNNVTDIGWFTGSVHPGEKGVSIITGHVAQIHGGVVTKQGVFYNLNKLSAGDKLTVLNDKGETITFVVRESRKYDPTADATDVFVSNDNDAHLNIITCEGTWNPAQLSYSQRLVVFTDAVQ